METTLVTVRDLRYRYRRGEFDLSIPSLDVEAGEAVACIGPSGSGKTTLLHLLAGILTPQSGFVAVRGTDWSHLGEGDRRRSRVRSIGLVFQEFELLDYLTVQENILLPARLGAGGRLPDLRKRAADLAAAAEIPQLMDRLPRSLSQGERQRVALCRALVARPPLLLADEPTGNLDPDTSARVLDLLLREVRGEGAGLLLVTHDHGVLDRFDRVVEMETLVAGATA